MYIFPFGSVVVESGLLRHFRCMCRLLGCPRPEASGLPAVACSPHTHSTRTKSGQCGWPPKKPWFKHRRGPLKRFTFVVTKLYWGFTFFFSGPRVSIFGSFFQRFCVNQFPNVGYSYPTNRNLVFKKWSEKNCNALSQIVTIYDCT